MRRFAILMISIGSGCTSGSGFTGGYEAIEYARQQGGCGGTQMPEAVPANDRFFQLGDVDAASGLLVAYYACTDVDTCDEVYDLARSFGRAKDDEEAWAGYLATAIPASPCVLTYRVRRLSSTAGGVAIDEQVFRESDGALAGAACNSDAARERGEGMPCIEESRLAAEDR